MASCTEAVTRSEALEGELAGCRGRLEGLGEGCGRCWHMLEEARVSSSAAALWDHREIYYNDSHCMQEGLLLCTSTPGEHLRIGCMPACRRKCAK